MYISHIHEVLNYLIFYFINLNKLFYFIHHSKSGVWTCARRRGELWYTQQPCITHYTAPHCAPSSQTICPCKTHTCWTVPHWVPIGMRRTSCAWPLPISKQACGFPVEYTRPSNGVPNKNVISMSAWVQSTRTGEKINAFIYTHTHTYTGWFRRNLHYFGKW